VGLGVPGVVDADAGVVLRSIPLAALNIPLRDLLAAEFGVTAVIDHDACFGACAEATNGSAADSSHFIYLSVNTVPDPDGIRLSSYGSAMYLGGKIYRGAFYAAGELGGPLLPQFTLISKQEMEILLDPEGAMPPALLQLAEYISTAIGPLVNLVDVQTVVLSGTARISNRRFIAAVQAGITDRLVFIPGRSVQVVRATWGLEAVARGAAIAAFDTILAQGQLFGDTDQRRLIRAAKEPAVV
jgi:predicted NBD/HSP70 family sugar kinase